MSNKIKEGILYRIYRIPCFLFIISIHSCLAISDDSIKIMPLGDSITQGDHQHNSYRRSLWKKLEVTGKKIDFVGSQNENFSGPHPHPDFDLDHEGHWGWDTKEIVAYLHDWASTYQPDIVLIHLGHNDLAQRKSTRATEKNFVRMIKILRRNNPYVKILIAHLIDTELESYNYLIQKLNVALTELANTTSTLQSPILIVPQDKKFNPFQHTYDGIHPNTQGEELMAQTWYQSIIQILENE